MSAAVLPFVAVAGTITSGFLTYQQMQASSAAAQMQANMLQQQARGQAQLTMLQIQQTQLEAEGQELELRDEANRKRRAARLMQEQAIAQQAGRGLIAQPFGSFEAILGDAENELYRDLESNRVQRATRATQAAFTLAGTAMAGTAAMQTSRYQQAAALADARTSQLAGYRALGSGLVQTAKIWPTI